MLHNFVWHERFTWADRKSLSIGETLGRAAGFNLTTGATSIFGNLIMMRILVGQAHLSYLPANVLSIAGLCVINFLLADRLVFQPPIRRKQQPTFIQQPPSNC